MTANPASTWALNLLAELARNGLRQVVIAPGSRSQALALAAVELERRGSLTVHVRSDERVAGFLALGLSRESGRAAAVITTSGTAVANLHPAVLEAHHAGVGLLVLSADRPVEVRGTGVNQTTVQAGIFAGAVRWLDDVSVAEDPVQAADQAIRIARRAWSGARHGPAHLNVAFREPLSGEAFEAPPPPTEVPPAAAEPTVLDLSPLIGTVVIAGADAGPIAEQTARELGAPLIAEVSSGARFGPALVAAYRTLLDDVDFGGAVRRAIVFGHPTLSRQVPALLESASVEVIVVRSATADVYNPGRRAAAIVDRVRVLGPVDADPGSRAWLGRWVHTGRALREPDDPGLRAATEPQTPAQRSQYARAELAVSRAAVTREDLVDAVWRLSWPHDRLVLGSSRLIRVADDRVPGKRITVHANRGLAGIDGTIATALGVALESQRPENSGAAGITRVLLGDLTALHDSGALQLPPGSSPRIQVIVGNDGGGTIFDTLEVTETADHADIDRVLYTPQAVDFAALAAAYGWHYRRAGTRGELEQVLTAPTVAPTLIEIPLPR